MRRSLTALLPAAAMVLAAASAATAAEPEREPRSPGFVLMTESEIGNTVTVPRELRDSYQIKLQEGLQAHSEIVQNTTNLRKVVDDNISEIIDDFKS